MLSRQEFFRALLARGLRAVRDLSGAGDSPPSDPLGDATCGVAETELSPALLAIEAERRGLSIQGTDPGELRRLISRELASCCTPRPPEASGDLRPPGGRMDPDR